MPNPFDCMAAPAFRATVRPHDPDRFLAKVQITDHCHIWTGQKRPDGYGAFSFSNGKRRKAKVAAHRFAYTLAHGFLPPHLLVCHRCDNPLCVNPAHLFLGTYKDNAYDMIAKGRNWTPPKGTPVIIPPEKIQRGSKIAQAKLTEAQIPAIRLAHAQGASYASIARSLSLDWTTVRSIVSRQTWKHVP